jgi:hypothetical protein
MKKLFLLLAFVSILYSCSNGGNASSSNNNGNSFTNSMDYEFTITINGQVNKIKGNTTNGIPVSSNYSALHEVNNSCVVRDGGNSIKHTILEIDDVTTNNYISGQNISCQIDFSNLLLGINQANVYFTGGYVQTLATSLGAANFIGFQTTSGASNPLNQHILPINITDLGTTSSDYTGPPYTFGQTLKGNYSGTIYLFSTTDGQYTIPVQLSIDFKALRMY